MSDVLSATLAAWARGLCDGTASPLELLAGAVACYAALILWQLCLVSDQIKYRHIPGPIPVPLYGNLLTIGGWGGHKRIVWNAYTQWRGRYGKVFRWFSGQQPFVVFADAEAARLICVKHYRSFHDRSLPYAPQPRAIMKTHQSGLTFTKGQDWAIIKSAMTPLVGSDGLKATACITSDAISRALPLLADAARKGESVDLRSLTSALSLTVITAAGFGVKLDSLSSEAAAKAEAGMLVKAAESALKGSVMSLWTLMIPYALRPLATPLLIALPMGSLRNYCINRMKLYSAAMALTKNAMDRMGVEFKDEIGMEKAFVNEHTKEFVAKFGDKVPIEGSVIDLLVRARTKDTGAPLKAHQVVAQANAVMVGGMDTTSFTMTSALFFLSTHPEAQARVIAEIDAFGRDTPVTPTDLAEGRFPYLGAVLKETLRLLPPVWCTSREAAEDIDVNGTFIPKGTAVLIDLYGMHRDASQFPEPGAFNPERFLDADLIAARHPYAYAGFGAGPKICLGYKLAAQEVQQVLASLYQRFTFELDVARTPLSGEGMPRFSGGIHITFADDVYFHVHERPAAAPAAAAEPAAAATAAH